MLRRWIILASFFSDEVDEALSEAVIRGDDARHICRSLRMAPGEGLSVVSGAVRYDCLITSVEPEAVRLRILSSFPVESEPKVSFLIAFALPKAEKAELIVQKCVELGVHELIPFISERSISRSISDSRFSRLRRIAREAAIQSGRGIIPEVSEPLGFEEAVALCAAAELPVILFEGEDRLSLRQAAERKPYSSCAVMSGPEGGFSPAEVRYATEAGLASVTLGRRILRCETAPICALSALMFQSRCLE